MSWHYLPELGAGSWGGRLLGWTTVCAVEKEPYCREVLLRRQRDGVLPLFPIWDDVKTFDGKPWRGLVDVVSAGFPCQPFSVAGKGEAENDDRNLWPETIRIIREVGPRFAFLENVPGLLSHDYFGEILGDLDEAGFDARWQVVSAAECGAPHLRKRLWIVAHARSAKLRDEPRRFSRARGQGAAEPRGHGAKGPLADSVGGMLEERREPLTIKEEKPGTRLGCWWAAEPDVGRVVDGVAKLRVDRLRALGNGQVPAVAREAWNRLSLTE